MFDQTVENAGNCISLSIYPSVCPYVTFTQGTSSVESTCCELCSPIYSSVYLSEINYVSQPVMCAKACFKLLRPMIHLTFLNFQLRIFDFFLFFFYLLGIITVHFLPELFLSLFKSIQDCNIIYLRLYPLAKENVQSSKFKTLPEGLTHRDMLPLENVGAQWRSMRSCWAEEDAIIRARLLSFSSLPYGTSLRVWTDEEQRIWESSKAWRNRKGSPLCWQ